MAKSSDIIVAVGDIHGEYLVLIELLKRLNKIFDLRKVRLVFQELTDRGSDSQLTIKLVREYLEKYPHSQLIQSNHDQMNSCGDYYGLAELESACLDYVNGEISAGDKDFLSSLPLYYESNTFLFVHGGLSRGVQHPSEDNPYDLLWNYGTHKDYKGEKRVVMGHSAQAKIIENEKTIYIDTGATFEDLGKLSAVVLNDKLGTVIGKISVLNASIFSPSLRLKVKERRRQVFLRYHSQGSNN